MIVNIIDRRKREYRFLKINAVVEPAWHDNSCKDSDKAPVGDQNNEGIGYAEKEHISLEAAITWAATFNYPATLYIYNEDDGIYCKGANPHKQR